MDNPTEVIENLIKIRNWEYYYGCPHEKEYKILTHCYKCWKIYLNSRSPLAQNEFRRLGIKQIPLYYEQKIYDIDYMWANVVRYETIINLLRNNQTAELKAFLRINEKSYYYLEKYKTYVISYDLTDEEIEQVKSLLIC